MEALIKALQIFLKYGNLTHCKYDVLWIVENYSADSASADDIAEIERLVIGFTCGLAYAKYEQTRERSQEKK